MWQEIQNDQDTSRLQPLGQPARRQCRVVKVMEPEADGGDIKVKELGRGKLGRAGVLGNAEVALVGVHLGGSEALAGSVSQKVTPRLESEHRGPVDDEPGSRHGHCMWPPGKLLGVETTRKWMCVCVC